MGNILPAESKTHHRERKMNLITIRDAEGKKIKGYRIYEDSDNKYIKCFGMIGILEVVKDYAYEAGYENLYTYKVAHYIKA